jgi:rhodanese-related sulfurtransferase
MSQKKSNRTTVKGTNPSRRPAAPPARQPNLILLVGLAALVVIVAAVALLNRPDAAPASDAVAIPLEISVQEAAQRRDAGAFMLDVREPSEWEDFHMPDATLIPLSELPDRLAEVPTDQPVVVVCRSGNRSQLGRDILLEAGYKGVVSMAGGMKEWRDVGFPVVSGP